VFPAGTGLVVWLGAAYRQAPVVSCRDGSDGAAALPASSGVVVALLDETAQAPRRALTARARGQRPRGALASSPRTA